MKLAFIILALVATPAVAQDYGPPDDAPAVFSVEPGESIDDSAAKYRMIRKKADKWEIAFQVLNATDAIQTCALVSGGRASEGNPLFGKHPSCAKVFGIKAVAGTLQYLLWSKLRRDNPKAALNAARWAVIIQGAVVSANMRFVF